MWHLEFNHASKGGHTSKSTWAVQTEVSDFFFNKGRRHRVMQVENRVGAQKELRGCSEQDQITVHTILKELTKNTQKYMPHFIFIFLEHM